MGLKFFKFQGTGNDFVILDNRAAVYPTDRRELTARLCDRKFGIGADGLILLETDPHTDFKMVYYNSDGEQSSMCGNGGRCLVAFARHLGLIGRETTFSAVDGLHRAKVLDEGISLGMQDVAVADIREKSNSLFLDTGSPHHVQWVSNLKDFKVYEEGKKIRYGIYGQAGSNINFVEDAVPREGEAFSARTYERGVEDETLSCGTGVTAVALALHHSGRTQTDHIKIATLGGVLEVNFKFNGEAYSDIWLTGPTKLVFTGEIDV